MKKIIAIDFDDTICDTSHAMLAKLNKKLGTKIKYQNLKDFQYVEDIFGFTKEENDKFVGEFLRSQEFIEVCEPISGSRKKIKELKSQNHKLYVVTGRNDLTNSTTTKRINKYFPDIFQDIIFAEKAGTGIKKLKSELCKNIGASIMIDDCMKYILDTSSHNIKSYLLSKPRNTDYNPKTQKGIIKINSWKDLKI